jgi:photosystem II stability/assembly factor-like uncharacterized protein
MKSIIIFSLISLLMYENLLAQNGWFQIQTGTNVDIKSIKFVNSQTGFFCSESGKIFKTTDGGFSWQMKYDNANTPLRSLFFINENTGWAGGGRYSFDLSNLFVLKTINGGESWTTVYNFGNFYYTISNLYFLNDQTGFATSFGGTGSGSVGLFLKTTNGGSNWTWLNTSGTSYGSIQFFNDQTGFITGKLSNDTGGDTGYIFKTTNSGINWNVSYQKESSIFNSISFPTAEKGFVSGTINNNRPVILSSTDIGNSWEVDSSFSGFSLYETAFPSANTGYVISSNSIFKTSNSGSNWSQQNVTFNTFNSLYFLNDNTGWIGGNNGMVFKTYTGGEILPLDTVSPKYFPLKVGNTYTYLRTEFPNYQYRYRAAITKDTIINLKKYFYAHNFHLIQSGWVRIDSLSGNLYRYIDHSNCIGVEELIDSLASHKNDTAFGCSGFTKFCFEDTTTILFNDYETNQKKFAEIGIIPHAKYYAKGIGLTGGSVTEPPPYPVNYNLLGCVVDGVVYGDTNLVVTYSVSGFVRNAYTFNYFNSGFVKAVKYDREGDSIITLAVTNINPDGSFTLDGIPNDSVDIMAYQDDQLDFVPTYYPSTIFWEQATTLYINTNFTNLNIFAYPVTGYSGNSYNLSGHVYKNATETNPLKDAYLYVKNGNNFYNADASQAEGTFGMSNIPPGTHNIIVNRPGYYTVTRNINVNDNIDTLKFYLDRLSSVTTISQNIPSEFMLHQNYPNPFNPKTSMRFDVSKKGIVEFRIYDISGKHLFTAGKNIYNPGSYNLELDMNQFSSGIYFVRLIAEDFLQSRKIVLLK